MAQKATEPARQKRGAALLAALLALMLVACFFVMPLKSAYANETEGTPVSEQQEGAEGAEESEGSGSESEPYTFDPADIIDAQTGQGGATIPNADVPLAESITTTQTVASEGSIINFVLVVVCLFSMLVALLAQSVKRTKHYRAIAVRTIAVTVGLVTIASWALIDRLQLPTQLYNDSTVFIAVLFGLYVVALVYSYVYEARLAKAAHKQ